VRGAEGQLEALATIRVLMQQVAEVGRRPVRGRNRQQHGGTPRNLLGVTGGKTAGAPVPPAHHSRSGGFAGY